MIAHLSADGLHGTVFENGEMQWSLQPESEGSRARLNSGTGSDSTRLPHRRIEGAPGALGIEFTQASCGSDRPALSPQTGTAGLGNTTSPGSTTLNATTSPVNGPAFPTGSPNVLTLQGQNAPGRIYLPEDCGKLCEIAFDADFEYYLARGGTIPDTIAAIEGLMNLVD